MRADNRALNATSAEGNIGGLIGTVVDDKLLKMDKYKNVNKTRSLCLFSETLLSPKAAGRNTFTRLETFLSFLHPPREIQVFCFSGMEPKNLFFFGKNCAERIKFSLLFVDFLLLQFEKFIHRLLRGS